MLSDCYDLSDRLVYIILNYPVWFKKNEGEIWRLTMISNKEECIQQITIQINCNRRQRMNFSSLKISNFIFEVLLNFPRNRG